MASFNKVVLVGNVTRDIELKHTPGGTAVTEVGMAINEKYKDSSGNEVDATVFVDVTFWGRTAEVISEFIGKGSSILIEGRLKLDTWEQDGQKRSKLKVTGEKMQMLDRKRDSNSGGQQQSQQAKPDTQQSADADVPF
jgi:single-strand DNA-binding protein